MAVELFASFVADADRALVRPAHAGIRNARGYLLYWLSGRSELVDSWTTYPSVALAAQAAQQQRPGIEVVYGE